MTDPGHDHSSTFGNYILRYRAPIGLVLIAITLFMLYWAAHVPIATRFEDLFPAQHPNTLLYRKFRQQYGGAQTLILMLRVKQGDIFNYKTLGEIQDITRSIDKFPGVNHNEVFSLASYRVLYARAMPGALVSTPFMYPNIPKNQGELDDLKNEVLAHREQLAGYVTYDLKGALVIASFNDQLLDYRQLFDNVQKLIDQYQDENTTFYASGAVMFAAWGYHYLPQIQTIFLFSLGLMLVILYLSLGHRSGWWVPIATGFCSAIWGLGFVSLMGFNFDPVMLVIPFILTARDLSHGIQWHGRYYDELDRHDNHVLACVATSNVMLRPGILAVLANIAGIVFVAVSDIPVLKQIGIGGAVWLGASLAMVFVLQPIIVSYLPPPRLHEQRLLAGVRRTLVDGAARIPISGGATRAGLIGIGIVMLVVGVDSSRHVRIGYQTPGTPIYRADAKINQDTAEIGKFVPTNSAWVVLESPNFPNSQSAIGIDTMRMSDDLSDYLTARGDAVAVIAFGTIAAKPMNMLLHNGFPKYLAMPDSNMLAANLWGFFFAAAAPDEPQSFFANTPAMNNSRVLLLLPDHTGPRLVRLRDDLDYFTNDRVSGDPGLKDVKLRYLGGDAGLYLATDDVIARLNRTNLVLVLGAIFVICAIGFRSIVAGIIFAIACAIANFGAFAYMNAHAMGLTVDTISVISLGIGLGIGYGIYTVARIRDEVVRGLSLNDAITTALRTTGVAVFATFAVMAGGMIPWVLSPLLFQNEMSVLLILLMGANLIVGLLLLPAYIAWLRPGFITRYARTPGAPRSTETARAVS